MITFTLFLATLFLAYSNGANDNFKGVATLFGSRTLSYRGALAWATVTTLAGSAASIYLAEGLVSAFSGKSLVPAGVASDPAFLVSVAAGAGTTVLAATFAGLPISTTHALVGGLAGAGFAAVGTGVNLHALTGTFFLPLVASPLVAVVLGRVGYGVCHGLTRGLGISGRSCACIGEELHYRAPSGIFTYGRAAAAGPARVVTASVDTVDNCTERYGGRLMGVELRRIVDTAHILSAGSVSFARGLNDTPKIVALLLVIKGLGIEWGMGAVALGMAAGGILNSRKVAEKISRKITPMSRGQGFVANTVTALMVIVLSRMGMPVSTTHVSVGSIFGIGLVTRRSDRRVVGEILAAWLLTLPAAALAGAATYQLFHHN